MDECKPLPYGIGVKKNLPLAKRYLDLCAAHVSHERYDVPAKSAAVTLLKELRKCVSCGELDVHHMICGRCRKVRYCSVACQQRQGLTLALISAHPEPALFFDAITSFHFPAQPESYL